MGHYTRLTRPWVDAGYREFSDDGIYVAHQPIYGLDATYCEVNPLVWYARSLRILRALDRIYHRTLAELEAELRAELLRG